MVVNQSLYFLQTAAGHDIGEGFLVPLHLEAAVLPLFIDFYERGLDYVFFGGGLADHL